jgi:starch phosphorylase
LKFEFLLNYNVSSAQIIIPEGELSHHISTAGSEASGISCIKFVINGCLIIAKFYGVYVEIAKDFGEQYMFIFGERVEGIKKIKKELHEGKKLYVGGRLLKVFNTIKP